MGAPAQRISRRLLSSARPPLFPVLLGLPFTRAFPGGVITGRQIRVRGKAGGGARRGAARQWPSGRKSAASGASDWLSAWRLSRPPRQFRLVGAESGDSGTMALVHREDCELGSSGER